MKTALTLALAVALVASMCLAFPAFMFTLLGWPAGIILGNLLASVVWSSVFEWRLRNFHRKSKEHVTDQLDVTTDGGLKDLMDAVKAVEAKLDDHIEESSHGA